MAKGSIATAWIQILPSLDGLQAALAKASRGSSITPKVNLGKESSSIFKSTGTKMGGLFSGMFAKSSQSGLSGALSRIGSAFTGGMGKFGSSSGSAFATGFSGYVGAGGIGTYLRLGAAGAGIAILSNQVKGMVGSLVSAGNEWGGISARLKIAAGEGQKYAAALVDSKKAANDIGVSVGDMVDSASRLVMLAPKTIPDYKTSLKFTKLLNENMLSTGASTEEAASATRQITQALGKGIVNGDELNSIMENSPQIAQMLAKHLNASVGDLKELGKAGKISGNALRDAVLENQKKIEEQFAKMPITADRALNKIKNDWSTGISDTAIKISETMGGALRSLDTSGIIDALAKSLDGTLPMFQSFEHAAENVINKFAPLVKKVFDPSSVFGFLKPLKDALDVISLMDFESLSDSIKTFSMIAAVAFTGILGGSSQLLSRLPIVGGMLNNIKNGIVNVTSAAGAMAGETVNGFGKLISKLGQGVEALGGMTKGWGQQKKLVSGFNKEIESMDFSAMPAKFNDAITDISSGTGDLRKNLGELEKVVGNLSNTAKENLPAGFTKAFNDLKEGIDSSEGNLTSFSDKLKTRFDEATQGVAHLAKMSSSIRINPAVKDPTIDVASVRTSISAQFSALTGIKIPDFLSQPLGAVIASATNALSGASGFGRMAKMFAAQIGNVAASMTSESSAFRLIASTLVGNIADGIDSKVAGVKAAMGRMKAAMFGDEFTSDLNSIKASINKTVSKFSEKFPKTTSVIKSSFTAMGNASKSGSGLIKSTLSSLTKNFGSVGNAALKGGAKVAQFVAKGAGKGLQVMGKGVSAVGRGFAGLGRMASNLGVTGAALTAVTTGFKNLLNVDPSKMSDQISGMFDSITTKVDVFATKLPDMANAFASQIPGLMSSLTSMMPSLVNSIVSSLQAIIPAIVQLMPQLINGFMTLFNGIVSALPTILPLLINGFTYLVGSLMTALPQLMGGLASAFIASISTIFENLPQLVGPLVAGFNNMFTGLAQQFPVIAQQLATAIPQIVQGLVDGLIANLPMLITGLTTMITSLAQTLPTLIPVIVQGALALITALVQALPAIITPLIAALPTIITSVINALVAALPVLIQGLVLLIQALVTALPQIIQGLIDALPTIIDAVVNGLITALPALIDGVIQLVLAIAEALPEIITAIIDKLPEILETIGGAILENFPKILKAFGDGFVKLAAALPQLIVAVIKAIPKILVSIAGAFGKLGGEILKHLKDIPGKVKSAFDGAKDWLVDAGKAILNGLLDGIKNAWKGVTDFVGGIGDWIKEHKGPLSYDKVMLVPAGNAIMEGLGKGLEKGFGQHVKGAIETVNDELVGIGDGSAWLNGGSIGVNSNLSSISSAARFQPAQQVTNNFPAQIIREKDDLYTAYPQMYRSVQADLQKVNI